jgi:CHAT domain-containing protein
VDLPEASLEAVVDQANALLAARERTHSPSLSFSEREAGRDAVFDVLAWIWQAITEPVLTVLQHTTTPVADIDNWPLIWWCPVGPMMVLPLHAAGRHPRTSAQYAAMGEQAAIADSVAGRVVSSYTTTLTALTQAHARRTRGPVRQLVVGVPDAAGQTHLAAVSGELEVVSGYLHSPAQATHLLGRAATHDAVLKALPEHSWLHLSCHAVQDPTDASRSAFLMHDRPLTLAELAALSLADVDLAYLAACQTAAGDIQLLDEARHLAAALQFIGYRHVLATLWSIADVDAPGMANTEGYSERPS